MESLTDLAEFRSPRFAPVLAEESQANPQVYGAELAFWLATELARKGVRTTYPNGEDWGWYIDYQTDSGARFAVHCGNVDGSKEHWFLQLRRFGRKLLGGDKPPFSDASALVSAIQELLTNEASVSELEWRYNDPP